MHELELVADRNKLRADVTVRDMSTDFDCTNQIGS